MLGMALVRVLEEAGIAVQATGRPGTGCVLSSDSTDIVHELCDMLQEAEADVVFNTWAYTQVDDAQDHPEAAHFVNATLAALPGEAIGRQKKQPHLVHYSTDFVFDCAAGRPCTEQDRPAPASVYGTSKLAGEELLLKQLSDKGLHSLQIIRTAWLFGPGKKNFVRTMLDLCTRQKELRVVDDQTGSPTYTPDLAAYSLALVRHGSSGVFHIVNSGSATWCELAREAVAQTAASCIVRGIASHEYPQKAKRPAFSVLDTTKFTTATGITPRHWTEAVCDYVHTQQVQADRCPACPPGSIPESAGNGH